MEGRRAEVARMMILEGGDAELSHPIGSHPIGSEIRDRSGSAPIQDQFGISAPIRDQFRVSDLIRDPVRFGIRRTGLD